MNSDFSPIDEIYYPDNKTAAVNTGIECNLEEDKTLVSSLVKEVKIWPYETLSEAGGFLYKDMPLTDSRTKELSFQVKFQSPTIRKVIT